MVNRPSSAFTPDGSAATSSGVGCDGAVGTTTASTSSHVRAASNWRWASRSRSAASARRRTARGPDDPADDRVDVVGAGVDEGSDGGVPLGDEGPPVEEVAGREVGAQVDRHHVEPDRREVEGGVGGRDLGVAPALHDRRVEHAEPAHRALARRGPGSRTGVGGVGSRGRLDHPRRQCDVAGEHRHAVEGGARGHDPPGREPAPRRLQPDDAADAAGTRPDPAVSVPRAASTGEWWCCPASVTSTYCWSTSRWAPTPADRYGSRPRAAASSG